MKSKQQAEEIPLEILFEDEDLLVLNKPSGLVVHPGAGNQTHTLVNALLHHCTSLSGIGGKQRPGIVHRLDKETSGCLVVAKNDAAHQQISRQFAGREVKKIYLAPGRRDFETSPRHDRGGDRPASGPAQENGDRSAPRPGRQNRLPCPAIRRRSQPGGMRVAQRAHPSDSRAPAASRASRSSAMRFTEGKHGAPRQMLHAWKLGFAHPRTQEQLFFEAPIPEDFRRQEAERLSLGANRASQILVCSSALVTLLVAEREEHRHDRRNENKPAQPWLRVPGQEERAVRSRKDNRQKSSPKEPARRRPVARPRRAKSRCNTRGAGPDSEQRRAHRPEQSAFPIPNEEKRNHHHRDE